MFLYHQGDVISTSSKPTWSYQLFGTPTLATAPEPVKVGTYSGAIQGTDGVIYRQTTPENPVVFADQYTVEWWQYCSNVLNNNPTPLVFGQGFTRMYVTMTDFVVPGGADEQGAILTVGFNSLNITAFYRIPEDTWVNIAVVKRNPSQYDLYMNGSKQGSINALVEPPVVEGDAITLNIATVTGGGPAFDGYFDQIRVSNIARYTSNFVPSTTPFVPDEYTWFLTGFENTWEPITG